MITAKLVDGDKLIARIERLYPALRNALTEEIQRIIFDLSAKVKRDKLSGQVLNVRTGRLRRSITTRIEESADKVTGIVGTNVEYAKGFEFGYTAKIGAGSRGGPKGLSSKALQRYYERNPPRMRSYPARPFLRPSLEEMRGEINERLKVALGDAVRKVIKE